MVKYQGKEVELDKPFRTPNASKKFAVYVTHPSTGNVVMVRFGDSDMEIKRDDDERRKSFRARHKCDTKTYTKDRHTPGYWSCRFWEKDKSVSTLLNSITKMELNKEIQEIEKTIEAIDKSKNPIEQNPTDARHKPVTPDIGEDMPEDKKPTDKYEDDGEYKRKKMAKEILDDITMLERKIYTDDPYEAPPGANVQVGPHGGYYYELDSAQADSNVPKGDGEKGKGLDKGKDLAKAK